MSDVKLRRYHAAKWDEPLIMELGNPGERGIMVPQVDAEVDAAVGPVEDLVPESMRRSEPPRLPEISQYHVLQHYLRLSQMTLGMETGPNIGEGTCTMKYSPKVNESFVRMPQVAELHPLQDEETLQGILQIMYELEGYLKEISGMDAFSLQPAGGSQAIFSFAAVMRAYHASRGELTTRDEVITTMFSHPVDAATPAVAGYKIITLMPEEYGYPSLEALKAVASDRTAGIFMTNPEDTGLYNHAVSDFVKTVHDAGGLCFTDQANANGILGIARARDAGFDGCHFNLHKTFSSPHACSGPAGGALGVVEELARFLPVPLVTFDGEKYRLDYDQPDSVGKIRSFMGNVPVLIRSYAWIRALGADGLRTVAETAALNHNYLDKLLMEIPCVSRPYAEDKRRIEQARYSLQQLKEDTGIGSDEVHDRMQDFGIPAYFSSHHPWVVPEPFTPEACETYSRYDLEYWAAMMHEISKEAYEDPDKVRQAPYNCAVTRITNMEDLDILDKCALTWRAYRRKKGIGK